MCGLLLRDVDPVPGSDHHGLGIDGSKSKVVAELETSSIGGQVVDSQYVRIRGVGYQILDISPRQIGTIQQTSSECKTLSSSLVELTLSEGSEPGLRTLEEMMRSCQ